MHFAYVPAFNRLGCEMLVYHYGPTDPAVRSDTKASHYMEFCSRTPQIHHALIGGNSVIFYTALRNATELESLIQQHNDFFTGTRRPSRAKLSQVIFPYALSRITSVPQFASIVHSYFGLENPLPKRIPISSVKYDLADLNHTDKKILPALVSGPSASDREIASVVKLSRQAVARMRKKYREEGLLTKICIPRLYRWGFEICGVAHPKFSTEYSLDRRLKSQPKEISDWSYYTLSKTNEAVMNFMVSKFTDYSEKAENVLGWYHKMKMFEEGPEVILFSLERSTELRTFDYYPAVKHLLQSEAQ
jgi:DNA-binding Lrp family transcriptional regulator